MKQPKAFASEIIDTIHAAGGVLYLAGGEIRLPRTFGFCRGVTSALVMLEEACQGHTDSTSRLFLLGQIIHNPWVNDHFSRRGVQILRPDQVRHPEAFITASDCAVIPAFGVALDIEAHLRSIGCQVVDTSCGDVRRLWRWACRAAADGFGILIFGRSEHDETVVTKSRLAAVGGKYLVIGNLAEGRQFAEMVASDQPPQAFRERFGPATTNAESPQPFRRLAQVSQTTMLYDHTMALRDILRSGFARRYGQEELNQRLLFEPTVCRATQDRQNAAVELCKAGCDLVVVVGGFGSSNTRHLYELAQAHAPTVFIEDAGAILSPSCLRALDPDQDRPVTVKNWLPRRRPLHVAVLAGASSPEIVVGQVVEKLAEFLR